MEEFYDKLKEFLKSHLRETLPIGSIYQIDKITITIDTIHGNTYATTFTINEKEVEDANI